MADTFVKIQDLAIATTLDDANTRIPVVTDATGTPVTEAFTPGLINQQSYRSTPVSTATDLRNVNENTTRNGQLKRADDTGVDYAYNSTSTASDDGVTVLAPTWAGGTGRWLQQTAQTGNQTTGNTEVLAADKVLSAASGKYQFLDGGAAVRNVDLYAGGSNYYEHAILNTGTTDNLVIRDEGASQIDLLEPGELSFVVWDTTQWRVI